MAKSIRKCSEGSEFPGNDQPRGYYGLLGLPLFESDPKVISAAAAKRIADLQAGQHARVPSKAIGRIAKAERCLLNRSAKVTYDTNLRLSLERAEGEHRLVLAILETNGLRGACNAIFGTVGFKRLHRLSLGDIPGHLSRAAATGAGRRYPAVAANALCCAAKLIALDLKKGVLPASTIRVLVKALCKSLQNDDLVVAILGAIKQFVEVIIQQGRVPPDELALGLARYALEGKHASVARECLVLIRDCGIEGALPMVPLSEQILKHPDLTIRREVCSILAWLDADTEQAFGLLLKAAGHDPDEGTRFEATQALLKIDPDGTRLADEVKDEVVRSRILAQLRQAGVTGWPSRRNLEREWGKPSASTPSPPTPSKPAPSKATPSKPTPSKPSTSTPSTPSKPRLAPPTPSKPSTPLPSPDQADGADHASGPRQIMKMGQIVEYVYGKDCERPDSKARLIRICIADRRLDAIPLVPARTGYRVSIQSLNLFKDAPPRAKGTQQKRQGPRTKEVSS